MGFTKVGLALGAALLLRAAEAGAQAPYSLPWQLRPVAAGNVVRSDTAVALMEDPATGDGGSTVASMLLASYKVTPALAPLVRLGLVRQSPPAGASSTALVNPALGALYGLKLSDTLKLGLFVGVTIPVGQGGGNSPDAARLAAAKAGILARSAMDNAMFAVNDLTIFPGAGLAYVAGGLTVQGEVTVLQLFRVRGDEAPAAGMPPPNPDSKKTNSTMGLHVGYFVIPQISLGGELRYQRWLSTPKAVDADPTDTLRDNLTFAVGPRGHFQLGEKVWLRPGVAYAQGLDDPMSAASYRIVKVDVPVEF